MTQPIRSTKLRKHAKGQPCTLRFEGCDGGGETTVLAHIRDRHKGMGTKASDLSACYACYRCHDLLDHHPHQIDPVDFYFHQLRALQETLEILAQDNVIIVPRDPVEERRIAERKPKASRKPIPSPKEPWGEGRKLSSRKFGS